MNAWIAKQGLKALGKVTDKVLKAREIKRLRDYVEKDNELDIQMKQVFKTINKYGKDKEEMEKEIAILKKDSHPPQEYICCRKCGCKIAKTK
jgi:hypothetical protein